MASGGISLGCPSGAFGSLRFRTFGPRPLIEDDSVRSSSSTLLNGQIGCPLGKSLRGMLDIYNLLDAKVSDIDYFYASRLPGEPSGGVEDIHTHPASPRTLRLSLALTF